MENTTNTCTLRSHEEYNYNKAITDFERHGFEKIGEGGFGVVLGAEGCVVKIIKDIDRCHELSKEKDIYNTIQQYKYNTSLLGRIPEFNLYNELTTYCHFNTERIYPPHSLWETDDDQVRVGFVIGSTNDSYLFKDNKPKRGTYYVDKNRVVSLSTRKLVHFYINSFDKNLNERDEDRGIVMGETWLVKSFTEKKVKEYCFAMGQLLAFLTLNCRIYPHDIEVVIGSSMKDRECRLYIYDFNECQFIPDYIKEEDMSYNIARALFRKDGRNYFPNNRSIYYDDFADGWYDGRDEEETRIIEPILSYYNKF